MTLKFKDTKLKLVYLWVASQCPSLKRRSNKNKLINKLLSFHTLRDATTSFELVYTCALEQTFNQVLHVNFKHEEDVEGKMSWMFESHNAWFEIELKWNTHIEHVRTTSKEEKSIELHLVYKKN